LSKNTLKSRRDIGGGVVSLVSTVVCRSWAR